MYSTRGLSESPLPLVTDEPAIAHCYTVFIHGVIDLTWVYFVVTVQHRTVMEVSHLLASAFRFKNLQRIGKMKLDYIKRHNEGHLKKETLLKVSA